MCVNMYQRRPYIAAALPPPRSLNVLGSIFPMASNTACTLLHSKHDNNLNHVIPTPQLSICVRKVHTKSAAHIFVCKKYVQTMRAKKDAAPTYLCARNACKKCVRKRDAALTYLCAKNACKQCVRKRDAALTCVGQHVPDGLYCSLCNNLPFQSELGHCNARLRMRVSLRSCV